MPNILTNLVGTQSLKYGDRIAFSFKATPQGAWVDTTWSDFAGQVEAAACALEIMGVEPGDTVGVFSGNRPEILMTDFGAFANRAVPVSIYATSSREQVEYIVNDARVKLLFVGDRQQYLIAREAAVSCRGLMRVKE